MYLIFYLSCVLNKSFVKIKWLNEHETFKPCLIYTDIKWCNMHVFYYYWSRWNIICVLLVFIIIVTISLSYVYILHIYIVTILCIIICQVEGVSNFSSLGVMTILYLNNTPSRRSTAALYHSLVLWQNSRTFVLH